MGLMLEVTSTISVEMHFASILSKSCENSFCRRIQFWLAFKFAKRSLLVIARQRLWRTPPAAFSIPRAISLWYEARNWLLIDLKFPTNQFACVDIECFILDAWWASIFAKSVLKLSAKPTFISVTHRACSHPSDNCQAENASGGNACSGDLYALKIPTENAFACEATSNGSIIGALSLLFLPCVEFTTMNDFLYLLFNYAPSTCWLRSALSSWHFGVFIEGRGAFVLCQCQCQCQT